MGRRRNEQNLADTITLNVKVREVEMVLSRRTEEKGARAASQKPSSADISETESGIIDPLVSKNSGYKNNLKSLINGFICNRFWIFL